MEKLAKVIPEVVVVPPERLRDRYGVGEEGHDLGQKVFRVVNQAVIFDRGQKIEALQAGNYFVVDRVPVDVPAEAAEAMGLNNPGVEDYILEPEIKPRA